MLGEAEIVRSREAPYDFHFPTGRVVLRWAMRFFKSATTLLLLLLGAILLLIGVVAQGWLSAPFIISIWAVAYLIENRIRRRAVDGIAYLGLPIFFVGGVSLSILSPKLDYPPIIRFDHLLVSTGVLKKGWGGNISLVKEDGSSFSLLCADNAGRYMTQTCVREIPEHTYGKNVIVYHEPVFKGVTRKAFFYEVRYGGLPLVKYNRMVKRISSRRRSGKLTDANLTIMLLVSSICSIIYFWMRWRSLKTS